MAKKPASKPQTDVATRTADDDLSLLKFIHAGTMGESKFAFVNPADAAALVAAGSIEVNTAVSDGFGKIAARTTDKGNTEVMARAPVIPAASAPDAATAVASKYEIDTDVVMVPAKRGRQSSTYPFDDLPVGGSFHIPATAEKPNPAKGMASTVSSANARFAIDVPGQFKANRKGVQVAVTTPERKFEVRAVDATDKRGAGARVYRTL
jgi:hypothetical protein